jgi:hypothetical protein
MTALLTLSGFKAFAERRAHYLADPHMRGLMDCEIQINPFFTIVFHRRRKS